MYLKLMHQQGNYKKKINEIQNNNLNSIEIFNVLGRLVKDVSIKQGLNKFEIDLTNLSKGIYLVNLKANGASKTQKLVIK